MNSIDPTQAHDGAPDAAGTIGGPDPADAGFATVVTDAASADSLGDATFDELLEALGPEPADEEAAAAAASVRARGDGVEALLDAAAFVAATTESAATPAETATPSEAADADESPIAADPLSEDSSAEVAHEPEDLPQERLEELSAETMDELDSSAMPAMDQPADEAPADEAPDDEEPADSVAADAAGVDEEPAGVAWTDEAPADAAAPPIDVAPADRRGTVTNPELAVLLDEGVDLDSEALEDAPTAAEALEAVFGDCAIVRPRKRRPEFVEAVTGYAEEVVDAIDATLDPHGASQPQADHDPALHEVLCELRDHLAAAAPLSTEELAIALRDGFARTQEELAQTNANLQSIATQLANLQGAKPVRVVLNGGAPTPTQPAAPPLLLVRNSVTPTVIAATLLMLCWAGLLWWRTGDTRIAIAAAAAANCLACVAFFGRRQV